MNKLYFKYGVMGSSKTANLLMTKFNYEQQGYNVLLLKPVVDTRNMCNGKAIVEARIGLKSDCITYTKDDDLTVLFSQLNKEKNYQVIMVDECQFSTEQQIEQLKQLSLSMPVLCYGLLTDFQTKLFEGSKRLVELADSVQEIKSICACGKKASVNVRFSNGSLVTSGDAVAIENQNAVTYKPMCYECYKKELQK